MHKIRVFLNPRASRANSPRWQDMIRRQLFRSDLSFVQPRDRQELHAALDEAIAENIDVVISVGGDGTCHALIQKLAFQKTRILALPGGTANDLATELGLNRKLRYALETVRRNTWKAIDLVEINGHFMATNGGIGFVSDVATSVNELRMRVPGYQQAMSHLKSEIYGLTLGVKLLTQRQEFMRLRITGPNISQEFTSPAVLINNQATIGGRFHVAPDTRNDDGHFNVSILTHQTPSELLAALVRIRCKIPPSNDPNILAFETTQLTIERLDCPGAPMNFIGDGELLSTDRRLEIKIHPKALRVFSPTAETVSASQGRAPQTSERLVETRDEKATIEAPHFEF